MLPFSSGSDIKPFRRFLGLRLWYEFMPVTVYSKKVPATMLVPSVRNRRGFPDPSAGTGCSCAQPSTPPGTACCIFHMKEL